MQTSCVLPQRTVNLSHLPDLHPLRGTARQRGDACASPLPLSGIRRRYATAMLACDQVFSPRLPANDQTQMRRLCVVEYAEPFNEDRRPPAPRVSRILNDRHSSGRAPRRLAWLLLELIWNPS